MRNPRAASATQTQPDSSPYALNKIVKTIEIAVFLSLGVMLTGTLAITPLLIVLLLFTNHFVTMALATDRAPAPPTGALERRRLGRHRRPDRGPGPDAVALGVLRRTRLAPPTPASTADAGVPDASCQVKPVNHFGLIS